MHFSFTAAATFGNKLFFSDNSFNGLFKMDLENFEAEFIGEFPGEEVGKSIIHKSAFVYGDKVIFTPNQGNNVHIYDIKREELVSIPIYKANNARYAFSESVISKNILYIMPGNIIQPIITVNLDNYEFGIKTIDLKSMIEGVKPDTQIFYKAELHNEAIYCPMLNGNKIIRYGIMDNACTVFDTSIDGLCGIKMIDGDFILLTVDSGIYAWNEKTNETIDISEGNGIKIRSYTLIKKDDHSVYMIPDMGGKSLFCTNYSGKWNCEEDIFEMPIISNNRLMGGLYDAGIFYKGVLMIFPTNHSNLTIWFDENLSNPRIHLVNKSKLFSSDNFKSVLSGKIQQEGSPFSLHDFLEI